MGPWGREMSDLLPESAKWSLLTQTRSILNWFESASSQSWCESCCRRTALPQDMARDLHSEAWVKLSASLARRTEAFPDLHDLESAHRYAARSVERISIDWARSAKRHSRHVEIIDDDVVDYLKLDWVQLSNSSILIDHWRNAVVSVARAGTGCSGCSEDIVLAASLRLLTLHQLGEQGSINELLYESLIASDCEFPTDRSEAARKRKSRCSKCVFDLLKTAATTVGLT